MRIFVDVDGTLTTEQRGNSLEKSPWRQDVIDRCKKLIADGHEVFLWSGNTRYAKRVAEKMGIDATACMGKPQMIVDNQGNFGRKLKRRLITPEEFVERDF